MAKRKSSKSKNNELIELLNSKYASNPKKFRSFMPEVAQMLDRMNTPRRLAKSPFGLTEHEKAFHQKNLGGILGMVEEGVASEEQAIKGLERCATLIHDDSLPEDVRHETLVKLLKAAVGKSPGSFRRNETVKVAPDGASGEIVNKVSLVRGVYLELDRNMHLVSISVSPSKVRERRKMLGIIGIGRDRDGQRDVSGRHDEYLAEIDPHGSS